MSDAPPPTQASAEADDANVRPYEPPAGDVVGGRHDDRREWFEWYRANPYVDHVPVAVVERPVGGTAATPDDGDEPGAEATESVAESAETEVVAALPFAAVRVRADDETALAMSPGELWTKRGHEDDAEALRRRALEGAVDYYATADFASTPAFFFTGAVPEPAEDDGEDDTDDEPDVIAEGIETDSDEDESTDDTFWEPREPEETYHRIHDHGALLGQRMPSILGRLLGTPISAVSRRVRRWRDGRVDFDTGRYVVMDQDGVPAATLAACYRSRVPSGTHAVFDEEFYRWWAARPDVGDLTTVVVYAGGDVAAVIVVERDEIDGVDVARIAHVLPVTGDPDRPDAVAAGMERLLAEHRDADEIRIATPLFPDSVRDAYGFGRADSFPTSLFVAASERRIGIRPIAGKGHLGDRPVGEAAPFLWSVLPAGPEH